jgi:hypothetical protein
MTPFTGANDHAVRAIDRLRYDRSAPDSAGLINKYARLPTPICHDLAVMLASTPDRVRSTDYDSVRRQPTISPSSSISSAGADAESLKPGPTLATIRQQRLFVLVPAFAGVVAFVFVIVPIALRRRFRMRCGGPAPSARSAPGVLLGVRRPSCWSRFR